MRRRRRTSRQPATRSSRPRPSPSTRDAFLPPDDLPRHVAIIMDGNRRWARQRDLPELDGHAAGVEAIRDLLRHAVRRGVPVMTLYAFSRENWARSDDEVTGLFGLLEAAIRSETDELRAQGVRIRLLGRLDELPDATRASIGEALDATAGGERLLLNIAFNYAGRTELVDAFRRLAASGIPPDAIDEGAIGARPVHGRPARPGPASSGPVASSASPTSSSGSPPTPSSIHAMRCGPISAPTRSMPRCSSSPAVNAASGAERTDQGRCVSERSVPRCSCPSCWSSSPSAAPSSPRPWRSSRPSPRSRSSGS